jgi:hypothetical protein
MSMKRVIINVAKKKIKLNIRTEAYTFSSTLRQCTDTELLVSTFAPLLSYVHSMRERERVKYLHKHALIRT